jgi:hypothetical protein
VIKPTVGRVVHFFHDAQQREPLAAHVAKVHSDTCVNLMVIREDGTPHGKTSVHLKQPEDENAPLGSWCEWMPFQQGQSSAVKQAQAAGGVT